MSMIINPYAFGVAGPFVANATEFDGTAANLSRSGTIYGSSSPVGIVSAWVRLDADTEGAAQYPILAGSGPSDGIALSYDVASEYFAFSSADTSDFDPAILATFGTTVLPTGWLNVLLKYDWSAGAGSRIFQAYVNDVESFLGFSFDAGGPYNFPFATTNFWEVGTNPIPAYYNGGLAELYFAPGQDLDLSITANRRKFISAAGKPVDLGSDGSTPTGTAPAIYLKNPYTSFGTNSGTGGNFTVNGTLTASPTSPSD